MFQKRIISLILIAACFGARLVAEEKPRPIREGDLISLTLRDKASRDFRTLRGDPDAKQPGVGCCLPVIVGHRDKAGRVYFEYFHSSAQKNSPMQMIELSGFIDPAQVKAEITPKGTAVYSSPADAIKGVNSGLTEKDEPSYSVTLHDLKGLKLRRWTLAEEVGN